MTPPQIINRGRGPEIAGTRITVYDIMDYLKDWHHLAIALFLHLSTDQVLAAIRYIEEHRDEVNSEYQQMLERAAAGNPPEVRAKLAESHVRLHQRLKEMRERKEPEAEGARPPGERVSRARGNGPMITPEIIDRGRGPEIAGTRITVYDILDYLKEDWHHTAIAVFLRISSDEVLAAIRYIEEHRDEVMADYQLILDRDAAGNPPELQARLEETHARVQAMLKTRRENKSEESCAARTSGGR